MLQAEPGGRRCRGSSQDLLPVRHHANCVPYTSAFIPSDPFTSWASFSRPTADQGPPNRFAGSTINFDPTTYTKVWGSNLTLDWKLPDKLALKSITAYRRFDSRWSRTTTCLAGPIAGRRAHLQPFVQRGTAPERQGRQSGWTSRSAAYYFDQTTTYATHQFLPYAGRASSSTATIRSIASSVRGFRNAAWHMTDALNVNAGARYTHEKKDYTYSRLPVARPTRSSASTDGQQHRGTTTVPRSTIA
ncbi:MAG: hypothetical protein U1F30_00245 [Steroidobacteraceae bacterium]